jgi:NAD(P)H-hydrate epimerase
MSNALPLYCADAVRAIERVAFARGVDALGLMTQAGEAAAALLRERWPQVRRVGVLCGAGNNGGDGYVAALALHRSGLQVDVVASGEPHTPEARAAAARWLAAGHDVRTLASGVPEADAWIDALFGIGLSRAPEAPVASLMQAVAAQRRPVLALDVPSGIDADRGSAPGAFLPAAMTLCFVAAKRGLFTAQGREAAGEVCVESLGLGVEAVGAHPVEQRCVHLAEVPCVLQRHGHQVHLGLGRHRAHVLRHLLGQLQMLGCVQQLDALHRHVLVLGNGHRGPPLLPPTRALAGVELGAEEADDDGARAHES